MGSPNMLSPNYLLNENIIPFEYPSTINYIELTQITAGAGK